MTLPKDSLHGGWNPRSQFETNFWAHLSCPPSTTSDYLSTISKQKSLWRVQFALEWMLLTSLNRSLSSPPWQDSSPQLYGYWDPPSGISMLQYFSVRMPFGCKAVSSLKWHAVYCRCILWLPCPIFFRHRMSMNCSLELLLARVAFIQQRVALQLIVLLCVSCFFFLRTSCLPPFF